MGKSICQRVFFLAQSRDLRLELRRQTATAKSLEIMGRGFSFEEYRFRNTVIIVRVFFINDVLIDRSRKNKRVILLRILLFGRLLGEQRFRSLFRFTLFLDLKLQFIFLFLELLLSSYLLFRIILPTESTLFEKLLLGWSLTTVICFRYYDCVVVFFLSFLTT